MPGNPENLITDKTYFHPKVRDISDFADLLRPEFIAIVDGLSQSATAEETAEYLLEAMAYALIEFTFPDEDDAMKIFAGTSLAAYSPPTS